MGYNLSWTKPLEKRSHKVRHMVKLTVVCLKLTVIQQTRRHTYISRLLII